MKKTVLRTGALAITALLAMATVTRMAWATDKYTSGKIGAIAVYSDGFVFHLEGGPALCDSASGGGTAWVTINTNYNSAEAIKNYLSILTASKLAGRDVVVRGVNSDLPNEWGCRGDGIDLP